jgi:class 3 adenylate cyclase/pimeloyl-ACP methyl ester carboxylesterase
MREVEHPKTKYTSVGDSDIAYQVVGDGDLDLVFVYGLGSHVERFWEDPAAAEFLERLAAVARLTMFDQRGTGASDGVPGNAIPTWEGWTEDIGAVIEAAGCTRPALLATLDAAPTAILFAAMHPEQVSALILVNSTARYEYADDYPIGISSDDIDALVVTLGELWGTDEFTVITNPGIADNPEGIRFISRTFRSSCTPRSAAAQYKATMRRDIRSTLGLVQAPTLVLHVAENPLLPVAHGRYIADHIEGAKFVELPGGNVGITDEALVWVDEIVEFLTGNRPSFEVDRILATVLFTDIVDSTKTAASLGDRRWRDLLDAHDRAIREEIVRWRGNEIKTTGDGFVTTFDGPARAIRCASAIAKATERLGVAVRMGLHTGECDVRGDDLSGLAVHIAARVSALAGPSEVLVSGTVHDLVVGSGIEFQERGEHELKGVPGSWKLFAVEKGSVP